VGVTYVLNISTNPRSCINACEYPEIGGDNSESIYLEHT
jgi:hypothetical protein